MANRALVEASVLDGGLTSIADAIREKGGTADALRFPEGMAEAVADLEPVEVMESLIERTITRFSSTAKAVGPGAFMLCEALEQVDLPEAASIGEGAFQNCSALASATEENFPALTAIGGAAFSACTAMTRAAHPRVTSLGANAFQDCVALVTAEFPAVAAIEQYTFRDCTALTAAYFPEANSIGHHAFKGCAALAVVDTAAVDIGYETFRGCCSLTAVILRGDTVCTRQLGYCFGDCHHLNGTVNTDYNPNGDKDGYFYVPAALVESYQTNGNWGEYTDQFRALESYTVDGTITGALDPEKI